MLAAAGSERINDMNQGGNLAMTASSDNGHVKVVELLIRAKADVNKCNKVGQDRSAE